MSYEHVHTHALNANPKFSTLNPEPYTDAGMQLKISDMGLSKRLEGEQSSFETLAGTWGWRAPEQILGDRCA